MTVHSYGILLYRHAAGSWQVMLVHPGGPFWAGKDDGAWSIPKGLPEGDEPGFEELLQGTEAGRMRRRTHGSQQAAD